MSDETRVGWTKAEYDKCPELAGRLHTRILDLEDENEGLRADRDQADEKVMALSELFAKWMNQAKRLREELGDAYAAIDRLEADLEARFR